MAVILAVVVMGACSGSVPRRTQPGHVDAAPPGWMPSGAVAPAGLGVKWDWDRVQAYEPYLRTFPGGDSFYELVWCDVEPAPGLRNWSRIDDVVDGAHQLGFEMNLKIRVGSCWATNGRLDARGDKNKTASVMPRDTGEYTDFVRAVVSRYAARGVHRYAVENEPNGAGFWQSTVADYERLARIAAPVIRATDAKAIVLDGGISATAYGAGVARWLLDQGRGDEAVGAYNAFYARRFPVRGEQLPRADDVKSLRAALRSDQAARNLSFLDATLRLSADHVVDAYQLHFYEPWSNVPLLLAYLHSRLPAGLPIESWETGIFWPGGDEAAVPAETAKLVSLLLAGGVRRIIWLPARHDPEGRRDNEYRFGLFGPDDQPRPGALVLRDMAAAAAGASIQGLPASASALRGVALTRDEQTVLVLWSDGGTRLAHPLPAGSEVRTAGGGPPPSSGGAGIEVNATPLELTLPGLAEAAFGLMR